MKVPIILKRGGKLKMAKPKEAKLLVKAGYATYQESPQTYTTRQIVAEPVVEVGKKRGRPKKVKEEVVDAATEEEIVEQPETETLDTEPVEVDEEVAEDSEEQKD